MLLLLHSYQENSQHVLIKECLLVLIVELSICKHEKEHCLVEKQMKVDLIQEYQDRAVGV